MTTELDGDSAFSAFDSNVPFSMAVVIRPEIAFGTSARDTTGMKWNRLPYDSLI